MDGPGIFNIIEVKLIQLFRPYSTVKGMDGSQNGQSSEDADDLGSFTPHDAIVVFSVLYCFIVSDACLTL